MKTVTIITPLQENKRITLGISHLKESLQKVGYTVCEAQEPQQAADFRKLDGDKIFVGDRSKSTFIQQLEQQELLLYHCDAPQNEGFYLATCAGKLTVVSGGSDTGALYGCLELAETVEKEGAIPREIAFADAPAYKLRGPAIGLQKTKIEPPRKTYEYPITPARFPWFYDKQLWQEFLDMMLKERCNVLYLWTGHPFSSLVKVPEYPEAMEVTEEEFQKNVEVFQWLTEEADRRGIWVVLKFYSIHISYPFAIKHNLELLQSKINPLVADYTRKSIAQFIKSFPHIGLMVCLGEALRGNQNKVDWFCQTVLPGVKDGMKLANMTEEPPVILRAHDCDPLAVMKEAMPIYSNLYTQWKYNGEGLTTWVPRGGWQKIHQAVSALGTTHIMNVHVLADLEPFRYGAPAFIQKCMQAGQSRLGTNGLHLYPLFFWDWPYSPDKTEPRLKQVNRDWLWYACWFRYAWNPDRDPKQEKEYWTKVLADHYGCEQAADDLLTAYEASGECAPRILRRVGITEGNRQTMSLGMTMSQFTNVRRYSPNTELWKSVAPQGERPDEYIEKEIKKEDHIGETPYDMIEDVTYYANQAMDAIKKAAPYVTKNKEEFSRLASDVEAIYDMVYSYCTKVKAAMKVLMYKHTMNEDMSGDVSLMEQAAVLLEESLAWYRKLSALTEKTYLYANSMQTPQRKIPFPNGETFGHWTQCLPVYEEEFENFKKHLAEIKAGKLPGVTADTENEIKPLKSAPFTLLSKNCETYTVKKGNSAFSDWDCTIQNCAEELTGLTGIRFGMGESIQQGVSVTLELKEESRVLVAYFNATGPEWLQVPKLETNTHADERGGLMPVLKSAMKITSCPTVNIHALRYEKGQHEIFLGTGAYLIVGVIPADEPINARNAEMEKETLESLDWLYEKEVK